MPLTNYAFADLITFTRSTTATFVGSNGLIQSAAINAPRFDFDPVTLAPLGFLIEEQRVNLLLNSDILGTNLSTQNVAVTAQSYTISFYGTGTITLSGAAVQIVVGTGAYPSRRTLTFTATAGVLTCTVTGTVQYAQLEAGTFPTSYIPTAASTVTRAPDVAVMSGTDFSPWFNANEGTIIASWSTTDAVTSSILGIFSVTDGTANERIQIRRVALSNSTGFIAVDGGVTQYVDQITASSGINMSALAYRVNDFIGANNGTLGVADTSGTLPTVTQADIGFAQGQTYLNGHLRNVTYYPTRLTNAQLQALTA